MADETKPAQAPTDGQAPTTLSAAPQAAPETPGAETAPAPGTPPADKAGAAGDGKEPEGKDAPPAGEAKAPEKYELSVPKGAETLLNAEELEVFATRARSKNLTNEQAQAALEEQVDELVGLLGRLRAQTEADPTYGGEHLKENMALVRRAITRVRPAGHPRAAAFERLLTTYGVGNHVEMFAFLADIGKLMAEDNPAAPGQDGAGAPKTLAQKFYGTD